MNRRIIKIFLASSIVEFATERMAIENFIRNISDRFEEQYDVKIQPLLCENFDDAYTVIRKQEEYNEMIRSSEFCFFIFFTKAGKYTREEFEVARKKFEETGKPKIYTYFKIVDKKDADQSLFDFMQELDQTFSHYYGTFEHIDTVKLRIILSLKLEEMDFVEIKTENGKCVVNGRPVLTLDNVSEFSNNKYLLSLQEELSKIEEEYLQMKPIYAKGNCSEELYRKYSTVASKRQSLIDEIEALQEMIFNVSLNLTRDSVRGEISQRQKEAYRLFELGDYEGCMAVLDSNQIDDEFLREEKREAEQRKARRKKYIREYRTKIEILHFMKDYANRFEEIELCYKKILPFVFEEKIELTVAFEYIVYLYQQNKNPIELAERLCEVYENTEDVNLCDKSSLYNIIALVYHKQGNFEEAEKYYLRAVTIRESLAKEMPESYEESLSGFYNNIGRFYIERSCFEKAEEYILKAQRIIEKITDRDYPESELVLSLTYDNLGVVYMERGDYPKAESCFLKSIAIKERQSKNNPDNIEPELAGSYCNIGLLYCYEGEFVTAEEYLLKSVEIRKRYACNNPQRYEPELAVSYRNAGFLYSRQDDDQKAIFFYLKAAEIYEKCKDLNCYKFLQDLADCYYYLGGCYVRLEQLKKAEDSFAKSVNIWEQLVADGQDVHEPDLAKSLHKLAIAFDMQQDFQKAEQMYLKAYQIREKLANKDSESYESDLAESYLHLGLLYRDAEFVQKAYEIAIRHPDDPLCDYIVTVVTNL